MPKKATKHIEHPPEKPKNIPTLQLPPLNTNPPAHQPMPLSRKIMRDLIDPHFPSGKRLYARVGNQVIDLGRIDKNLKKQVKEALVGSLNLMAEIIKDENTPKKVKYQVAKTLMTSFLDKKAKPPTIESVIKALEYGFNPHDILRHQATISAIKLAHIRDNTTSDDVARKAAVDILDRAGFGKVTSSNITHNVIIKARDIENMRETIEILKSKDSWELDVDNE